ncbi:MAG TPA: SDR family oxidoreductase [Anaerolineales bacterium]|nr:SDR family oxidoreductase [Anaerolineales bacterium]HRQ91421.1 SDR family oxidoreductase [Anaerolineales bacterium]
MTLEGKNILVTGGAVRVGAALVRAIAAAQGTALIHYNGSTAQAAALKAELESQGATAHLLPADLSHPQQVSELMVQARQYGPLYALVNNAAIFENIELDSTKLSDWQRHLDINLTAPFLLSQAFWRAAGDAPGRIVNILDWRAMRPGPDHLPYTVSKVALAGLTRSLAAAMAPTISVNGIALGAILPPSRGAAKQDILNHIPAQRWAELDEVGQTLLFLLNGPSYITGEIIHLDGGRHLV